MGTKKYAIIVAGGSGSRMGSEIPKQFLPLNGYPLLWWSLKAFHNEDKETELILVLPETHVAYWKNLCEKLPCDNKIPHKIAAGGSSRTESVKNGLEMIVPNDSLVAVHDAARPCVSRKIIEDGWNTAKQYGAAVPAVPVIDSLRTIVGDSNKAVSRDNYVAVQTPQVFETHLLKKAYETNVGPFTDDASAVELIGTEIKLFKGSYDNRKVTNPGDLEYISLLLKNLND